MLWVRWTEVGPCLQHQSKIDVKPRLVAFVQHFESSSVRSLADQEVLFVLCFGGPELPEIRGVYD